MNNIFSAVMVLALLSLSTLPLLAMTPAAEVGSAPALASASPDRLEYDTAVLVLTFHRTGLVRVDYTLNLKGVSRADIESGFAPGSQTDLGQTLRSRDGSGSCLSKRSIS